MGELYKSSFKKIREKDLIDYKVKIEDEESEEGGMIELNERGLLEYLKDKFDGGRTISSVKEELIRDGIKGSQWKTRVELLKLLDDIAEKNN